MLLWAGIGWYLAAPWVARAQTTLYWDTTSDYWSGKGKYKSWSTSSAGGNDTKWQYGADAFFTSSAVSPGTYTATLDGAQDVGNLGFENGNFTVTGYSLNLLNADTSIDVAPGLSATVDSALTGASGTLSKTGAGTLVLSGANTYTGTTNISAGTLQVGASAAVPNGTAMTVANGATFNLNGYTQSVGALSGAGALQLAGGTLVVGSGNASSTFSGSFASGDTGVFEKTGTGTLTFGAAVNDASGNLTLNGGTLDLGGFTSTFNSLTVTGNSTLDFSGASILNLNSLSVDSGATLTVTNWTDTVDYFYSLLNPGATNLGRIVFSGFTAGDTHWNSWDSEVSPVPEPATYGAVMMALGLLFCVWVKRRRLI